MTQFTNQQILDIVVDIRKHGDNNGKYMEFKMWYPRLYECALDKTFSLGNLHAMLDMKANIDQNLISVNEADEKIYDQLRYQYIEK